MATTVVAGRVAETRAVNPVPNPFPLTLAGMLAALGPQAINFGISIGGGEAYLLPNVSARGTLHMHWLMTVSVVLETALVYECIKYSICTGRSFFAATNDLGPRGFWPWFWAVVTILTFAWPAWMGGAVIAAHRFSSRSTTRSSAARPAMPSPSPATPGARTVSTTSSSSPPSSWPAST
jgi:hypothetical protein